jgi:molybdenum cofactor cytidylyltransferase
MDMRSIFNPPPRQFGLRGDIVLWSLMSFMSPSEDVYKQLLDYFEEMVGPLGEGEDEVYVKDLDNSIGMSRGWVSKKWWRNKGFPLIKKRIEEQNKKGIF